MHKLAVWRIINFSLIFDENFKIDCIKILGKVEKRGGYINDYQTFRRQNRY